MGSGLEHLLAEGVISEVLARLQSGKEAEVYVVRFGGKVVAAKVYKDRATRSFKNNADYKEGRAVRNSRSARAMASGSRFGKAAAEDAWKAAEANALYQLHAAEVRVPAPVLYIDGVLLMEVVLDATGNPARRLIDTGLTPEDANRGYHDMLRQLVRILSCDLIHGDLSPYNVLWAAAGPTIIDFPQIISASHNSSSERFFRRDAENILGHFASIDRSLQARRGDIAEIWRTYVQRELTPDFLPSGRFQALPRPQGFGPRPGGPRPDPRGGNDLRGRSGHPGEAHAPSERRGPNEPRHAKPTIERGARPPGGQGARPQERSMRVTPQDRGGRPPQGPRTPQPGAAPPRGGRRPAMPEVIVLPRRSLVGAGDASPPPVVSAEPAHAPPGVGPEGAGEPRSAGPRRRRRRRR